MNVYQDDYSFVCNLMKFMMIGFKPEWQPHVRHLVKSKKQIFTNNIRRKVKHIFSRDHFYVEYANWFDEDLDDNKERNLDNFKPLVDKIANDKLPNVFTMYEFILYCCEMATLAECGYLDKIIEAPDYVVTCFIQRLYRLREEGHFPEDFYTNLNRWSLSTMKNTNYPLHPFIPPEQFDHTDASSESSRGDTTSGFEDCESTERNTGNMLGEGTSGINNQGRPIRQEEIIEDIQIEPDEISNEKSHIPDEKNSVNRIIQAGKKPGLLEQVLSWGNSTKNPLCARAISIKPVGACNRSMILQLTEATGQSEQHVFAGKPGGNIRSIDNALKQEKPCNVETSDKYLQDGSLPEFSDSVFLDKPIREIKYDNYTTPCEPMDSSNLADESKETRHGYQDNVVKMRAKSDAFEDQTGRKVASEKRKSACDDESFSHRPLKKSKSEPSCSTLSNYENIHRTSFDNTAHNTESMTDKTDRRSKQEISKDVKRGTNAISPNLKHSDARRVVSDPLPRTEKDTLRSSTESSVNKSVIVQFKKGNSNINDDTLSGEVKPKDNDLDEPGTESSQTGPNKRRKENNTDASKFILQKKKDPKPKIERTSILDVLGNLDISGNTPGKP